MNGEAARLARSEEWSGVRRRVFRQLIESLLYEGIIKEPLILEEAEAQYALRGQTEAGAQVQYVFRAVRKQSFGRIGLTGGPVMRFSAEGEAEADSIPRFLMEIGALMDVSKALLTRFAEELQQTLLKDAQSARWLAAADLSEPESQDYDAWESAQVEGHPYHPCYKSRIGFTLADNLAYGPEFRPEFRLIWLAIRSDATVLSLSDSLRSYAELMEAELGEELTRLTAVLRETVAAVDPADYVLVPVHPWQWERILSVACLDQLASGEIVYLGQAGDEYRPQQSIRTLTNRRHPGKPYVKLPMNIVNTSSGRILAQHTIVNAARISDWLGRIVEGDAWLSGEQGLIVLREIAGISYHHQKLPDMLERQVYGSLGAIWRESLHPRLVAGEAALPFTALGQLDRRGQPVIAAWVQRYGLDAWVRQLMQVTVTPLLHLLYVHGVGLESHAQNMMLVLEQGWPKRLALKDFHDGVRYCPAIPHPLGYPDISYPPANHHGVNRNSFIEKQDPAEVRDFLLDALLFINLSELAFFVEEHFGLSEQVWWRTLAEVIVAYQERFPERRERYEQLDVFAPDIEVEQLTRRRIDERSADCVHRVSNPLHAYRRVHQD
ncbi:hypothetical protein PA598K_04497 [Paenibacillus sp. 598K]|uniref:IucA/IucC family protein n=1 Tax=Paenibacillus sp. 598K TaxID=1117987 RepID=UPI000FF92E3F|nr:IucA/IucC family protein [Paenibacillus sp. 598K]GBF76056.1 hypothetical protein PA598K_04497 [Paenibacillus sp. 598K]